MCAHMFNVCKHKKLVCAHIVARNFSMHMWPSEHTLQTEDAHHECTLHELCTLHVWCSYNADVGNELLIGFFIQYRLKVLMKGCVHTKYARI